MMKNLFLIKYLWLDSCKHSLIATATLYGTFGPLLSNLKQNDSGPTDRMGYRVYSTRLKKAKEKLCDAKETGTVKGTYKNAEQRI